MKLIMLMLSLIFSFTSANAVTDRNEYFTSTCEEQLGVGLMWKDLTWKEARVSKGYLSKYIAKKMKMKKNSDGEWSEDSLMCVLDLDEEFMTKLQIKIHKKNQEDWENNKKIIYWDACYNIREFGESFYGDDNQICSELWVNNYGKYELMEVSCEDVGFLGNTTFYFSPDGWFHKGEISSDLRNYPDPQSRLPTKNPLTITVGKCSTL